MMISILLSFKNSSIGEPTASASVAFFFVYMFIFGASCNCIPWVYVPGKLRRHRTAFQIGTDYLLRRNPATESQSPWYCHRHLFKLALGKFSTLNLVF